MNCHPVHTYSPTVIPTFGGNTVIGIVSMLTSLTLICGCYYLFHMWVIIMTSNIVDCILFPNMVMFRSLESVKG